MRILALDIAPRRTGWARDGETICPPDTGVWEPQRGKTSHGYVGLSFQKWLFEAVSRFHTDMLVYEDPLFAGPGVVMARNVAFPLIGMAWTVESIGSGRGIPVAHARVQQVRKHFLGTIKIPRKEVKAAVMARCKMLGWSVATHDAADAAALWAWAKATFVRGFQYEAAGPLFEEAGQR